MKRTALATLLLVAGCGDPIAPLPDEGRPDVLEFSYGGFGIGSWHLELRADTVVYWTTNEGEPDPAHTHRNVVGTSAWRDFWGAAERAGVHRWQERYVAEDVVDGNGWNLRLEVDGRMLESSGSNSYPDRRGRERELAMPDEFRDFMSALQDLNGLPRLSTGH
jgi:hypothetical protein